MLNAEWRHLVSCKSVAAMYVSRKDSDDHPFDDDAVVVVVELMDAADVD
jgi:hypothetical protein